MTKLCRALFKYENERKNRLIQLTYNFVVHSHDMACRKRERLWMEPIRFHVAFLAQSGNL